MTKNDPFGGATVPRQAVGVSVMEVNGMKCQINLPKALSSRGTGDDEIDQGLPPYAPRKAFKVDDCAAAPADWQRSTSANVASYLTAVKAEHGMWLDFNANWSNPHDVAVQISIQGVNAVTGLPVSGFALEQYNESCPKHGVRFGQDRFGQDRFCASCNYAWPAQNYLTTSAGRQGLLWLDGFRAADGVTRQFVFTENEERGVAAKILGDKRSFSLGVAFYKSVRPHNRPAYLMRASALEAFGGEESAVSFGAVAKGASKSLDIAAGARIKQEVHADPYRYDYWEKTPAGVLYIYYADEVTARAIIGQTAPLPGRDGFMTGLQTGHQPAPFDPFAG